MIGRLRQFRAPLPVHLIAADPRALAQGRSRALRRTLRSTIDSPTEQRRSTSRNHPPNSPSDRIVPTMLKRTLVVALLALVAIVALRHAGSFLVVNQPEHADLIVVLAGGNNDLRYWNGVQLMKEGYAPRLMLDVFAKAETFGNWDIDLARDFVNRTSPGTATVCALQDNSTYAEAHYLGKCLQDMNVKSVLVVTSAYHTRRALAILSKRLPQYHFSIYAAPDTYFFGERWWQTREWAKTTYSEWQRYLWWLTVDRWSNGVVIHQTAG
jgi:uncharacterized SAM-binding protein YcdF (DUF218 family)